MSLCKHERLRGRGGKFLIVDVGWVRVKGGKEVGGKERVVETGLGGEGFVFIQWRRKGGSVEVCDGVLSFMQCIGVLLFLFGGGGLFVFLMGLVLTNFAVEGNGSRKGL